MPYFAALGGESAENHVSDSELATANDIKRLVDDASMEQVEANLVDVQSLCGVKNEPIKTTREV